MHKIALRQALAATGAGCLLVMLSACADHSGVQPSTASAPPSSSAGTTTASPSEPGPDPVPKTGLTKGMVLPLEAYMENYSERRAISNAEGKLEIACMARYGFSWAPPSAGSPPPGYDDANMARRYGLSDPDMAAKYGYKLPDETPPPSQQPMSDAEIIVLTGSLRPSPHTVPTPPPYHGKAVPPGGCAEESIRKIEPAPRRSADLTLPSRLDAESLDRSKATPVVQAALKAWSACMASKGYTVATPFDAMDLQSSPSGRSAGGQGISVAVADVSCKEKTGLIKTWFTAESSIQQQQIEQNQLALQAVREQLDASVKAAAATAN